VRELEAPLLVCEPVLAEVMYLLGELPEAQDALRKYRDRPMSLADACIVRMAEFV
jgi:uncharacterized protein